MYVCFVGISRPTYIYFFYFWLHSMACGILVSQSGIEPTTTVLESQSLNYWTTREGPVSMFCYGILRSAPGLKRLNGFQHITPHGTNLWLCCVKKKLSNLTADLGPSFIHQAPEQKSAAHHMWDHVLKPHVPQLLRTWFHHRKALWHIWAPESSEQQAEMFCFRIIELCDFQ